MAAYDVLRDLDWLKIAHSSFLMKYIFDDHGYVMMVSNLAAVFGEKLHEKAILERFQVLNPFAEMLPKVILKHVKLIVKDLLHETELKIVSENKNVTIEHHFNNKGVPFMFKFELNRLSDDQFKAHILRPTLLRTVILDEEKSTLQRKVEELDGKQNSSSSGSSDRRNIKTIYSNLDHGCPDGSDVLEAFLYLQKDKITVPESLKNTPNVSPMKGTSSSTSSLPHKIKDLKSKATNIPYEEGAYSMTLEYQNITQQLEEPATSLSMEKIGEDESSINESDSSPNNLSTKKEEIPSKPALHSKPINSKRRKLLRF